MHRAKPAPARRGAGRSVPPLGATNLAGISALMNPAHVKTGVDLRAAENAAMGRAEPADSQTAASTLEARLQGDIERLTRELCLGGPAPSNLARGRAPAPPAAPAAPAAAAPAKARSAPKIDRLELSGDEYSLESGESDRGRSPSPSPSPGPAASEAAGESASTDASESGGENGSESESDSDGTEMDDRSELVRSHRGAADGSSHQRASDSRSLASAASGSSGRQTEYDPEFERTLGLSRRYRRRPARADPEEVAPPRPRHSRRRALTGEEERHARIGRALADMRGDARAPPATSLEREREQEQKASMLEQIGQLRSLLKDDGISCEGVGNPTQDSTYREVEATLSVLQMKNTRNRYSTIAEELMVGTAEALENIFDGTRRIPLLGWKPDYSGYSSTVVTKLHRMRFETGQMVGRVIERFNLGPSSRIALELLPSLLLYPRQRARQQGEPGLASDPSMLARGTRDALSEMRARDARARLASLDEL